ncbi:hypothetical protein CVS40_6577 [Lucilia cuprina]|nr:hypothetical protein CVS40_6577 [Lucilia cuprina]
MYFKLLYIIILNIFLVKIKHIDCSRRRFYLELHNFSCQKYGKQLKQLDCMYKEYSKNHFSFSHTVIFDRDMDDNFKIRIWIDVKQLSAKKYFRFADIKLGACSSLSQRLDHQFIRLLATEYKRTTNLPIHCPFKGNFLYKMDNFTLRTQNFPAYAPECSFTFGFDFYDINTLFGRLKVMGSIVGK